MIPADDQTIRRSSLWKQLVKISYNETWRTFRDDESSRQFCSDDNARVDERGYKDYRWGERV
jgi:hypothetical protein